MLLGILVTVCPQRAVTANWRISLDLSRIILGVQHAEYYFANVYFHVFGDAVGAFRPTLAENSECGYCDHGLCASGAGVVLCGDDLFTPVDQTNLFNV